MLRYLDLGASLSRFGCFVFEYWVLGFLDLDASFSRLGCLAFEIWVLLGSVFVFDTTHRDMPGHTENA